MRREKERRRERVQNNSSKHLPQETFKGNRKRKKMWHSPKILRSSHQPFHPQLIQQIPTSSPILKPHCKFSRRELTIYTNTSLLLLLNSQTHLSLLRSEETQGNPNSRSNISICTDRTPTKRAFLDVSIDGEQVGRIIFGIDEQNTPVGAARLRNLISGAAGISYRKKEFIKIMPNYIQHGGVRSYGGDAEMANRRGSNLAVENLVKEWERVSGECLGTKNLKGSVGIIVRDPFKPPPKVKIVARKGKLEIDEEEVGKDVNGTEFVIATRDSPELDSSALVVGKVLEGMEVVERIGQVKTVQENSSSPYFRYYFCLNLV